MELMVTEKAKDKLKELGLSGHKYLRVGVKTGGCSGHLYDAMIEEKMNERIFIAVAMSLGQTHGQAEDCSCWSA